MALALVLVLWLSLQPADCRVVPVPAVTSSGVSLDGGRVYSSCTF